MRYLWFVYLGGIVGTFFQVFESSDANLRVSLGLGLFWPLNAVMVTIGYFTGWDWEAWAERQRESMK